MPRLIRPTFGGVAELVECTGLENRRTLTRTGGSNPSSSALIFIAQCPVAGAFFIIMDYTVYILRSEKTGKHYYGHSQDVQARLNAHNRGKVRSTKGHKPWEVVYTESFETRSEAYKREMFYKSIDGYNFLKSKGII